MDEKKKKALAVRFAHLASKLRDSDTLPASRHSVSFLVGERSLGVADENADAVGELVKNLLQQCSWSAKYSESHTGALVHEMLGKLHGDCNQTKAEQLLTELDREYEAYQKTQVVLIPLSGIEMHEPELKLGHVTIKKMTPDSIRGRLAFHAGTQIGRHLIQTLGNSVVAEFSIVAEPARAKEIAVDETRRVMELLRYSIAFSPSYKQLGMNVSIAGDFPEGSVNAVVLPSPEDTSMTLTSDGKGPAVPYRLNKKAMDALRDCGALEVSAILAKPVASLTDFEEALLRAMHWFASALTEPELENELLKLITCLEAFLTPRDGNPIGTANAEGVALLLGKTLDERKKLKKKVRDLYGKRSGVSHGGKKAVLEADLKELREIAKCLIQSMIPLRTSIQSQEELLDHIENMKLGGDSGEDDPVKESS